MNYFLNQLLRPGTELTVHILGQTRQFMPLPESLVASFYVAIAIRSNILLKQTTNIDSYCYFRQVATSQ